MDVSQETNVSVEAAKADQETNQQIESTPNVNDQAPREAVKIDTHKRVLDEAKAFKKRAQEAERRLEEIEKQKLQEQGKYQELSDTYKQQLERERKVNLELAVRMAVSGPAAKAGCVDLDDLLKLGDTSFLEYDPETGGVSGAESFVENMKTQRPYLFQQPHKPVVNPAVPGGTPTVEKKEKSLEDALLDAFQKK